MYKVLSKVLNSQKVMDAQIKPRMEECVRGMGQRSIANVAASKGALTKPRREEYAEDTEHTAAPDESTAFAHVLDQNLRRLLRLLPISAIHPRR
jgi:hypothetical protein